MVTATARKILFVGSLVPGGRTGQRLRAMGELSHHVAAIPTNIPGARFEDDPGIVARIRHRLRLPGDPAGANAALLARAGEEWDAVWFEIATMIHPWVLRRFRRACPGARLIWYAEDDMMRPANGSYWLDRSLGLFDLWVTTKSFNARSDEMPARGVRRALFVNNSYDPATQRPLSDPPSVDLPRPVGTDFGAEVCFVGTFEPARAGSLLYLAEGGIGVRVWGNGWANWLGRHPLLRVENRAIYDDDYARAISTSRINLCFLRKHNRDLQTCRSMEIPACGGFMLHERNREIMGLFAEDREAAYFGDDAELVEKCRIWLADDAGRTAVAARGFHKATTGGHTHHDRVTAILEAAFEAAV